MMVTISTTLPGIILTWNVTEVPLMELLGCDVPEGGSRGQTGWCRTGKGIRWLLLRRVHLQRIRVVGVDKIYLQMLLSQ